MPAQLLLLVLIVMGLLLWKNKHRAKEFLVSFLNFEGMLVIEVRPHERIQELHVAPVDPCMVARALSRVRRYL